MPGGVLTGMQRGQEPQLCRGLAVRHVTDIWRTGHGYWMRKARVVELRICNGSGRFRLGGEWFLALGWREELG